MFVEKLEIVVEDVVFVVIDFKCEDDVLVFWFNIDDFVIVGFDYLIVVCGDFDIFVFYFGVCYGIEVWFNCSIYV